MDRISIIVPVYNVEKYLDDCIESIINQTYSKIEILLIDDGSTDSSGKMCDEYLKKDSRIKVFHKKNGGLSDARNYGLNHMSGSYVTFVDSDDIISLNYVELLYNNIKNNNADLSICRFKRFQTKKDLLKNKDDDTNFVIDSNQYYLKTLYQYDHTLFSVSSCAKLYKKSIFDNLRFKKGKLNEDFYIIGDIIKKTKVVSLLDKELYYYRISENSITNSSFNINKLGVLDYCNQLLKIEKNNEIIDAIIVTIYTRSIDLLTTIKECKYKDLKIEKKLWDNIKKYRFKIFKNNMVRKKIKISTLLSLLGQDFLIFFNVLLRKYKKKRNIQ